MTTEVVNEPESNRYVVTVDGRTSGFADYRIVGDDVVFPHTVIDPASRGRGLGAILVKGALDDVRPTGRRVVPQCWYVAQFIDTNPEYGDLLTVRN